MMGMSCLLGAGPASTSASFRGRRDVPPHSRRGRRTPCSLLIPGPGTKPALHDLHELTRRARVGLHLMDPIKRRSWRTATPTSCGSSGLYSWHGLLRARCFARSPREPKPMARASVSPRGPAPDPAVLLWGLQRRAVELTSDRRRVGSLAHEGRRAE